MQNCLRTPNSKFFFEMLLINLAQSLRKFLFYIFKGCAWNKICFLLCLKAKHGQKLKKFVYPLTRSNKICPFWGIIFFEFSIWQLFFEVKGRYIFSNFQNKNLSLRSLWFLRLKTLPRAQPNSLSFLNWTQKKIYLIISSIVPVFENQKSSISLQPTYYRTFRKCNLI